MYSVRVQARKKSNQVYGSSGTVYAKTLGGAVINSCTTVTADASSVSLTMNVTVYNAAYSNYVTIKNGSTTVVSFAAQSWAVGTANRTITLTSDQRAALLNAMQDVKSLTATVELVTKNGTEQIGNARMGDLASKVTAALGGSAKTATPSEQEESTATIKASDLVSITGSTYYNGKTIPGWVKKLRWYVCEVSGDRAVINKDESGKYAIMSPVKTSALAVAGAATAETYRVHTVAHGDTLWAIAKKYLGNGSRYKEIVSLNGLKSNVIYSGMKLKIPNK